MIQIGILAALAMMDSTFVGYRSAAGRNPRIEKRDYYRRAFARGALAGVISLAITAAVASGAWAMSSDPGAAWAGYEQAAVVLLWIYGTYTATVLGAFSVYWLPSMEVRVLMSVGIFGPLTLLRPYVISGALCAAMLAAPGPATSASALAVATCALGVEPLFDWLWRSGRLEDTGLTVGVERD